ncbi:MAG: tRNA (adenosine(37)-N6)-dimethylallyltransferase MiaA [Chloroflexota bacterium]|nr:tRNA (adenosine(37)-N6)-dimethylallyltransferase MiaA [Dehalococcoidia bacterium]MDW8253895.1 tRNA (adenosine(37)-N6)-dimethylallyltransferase MiaA [Chloroflexota bacterium]
MSAVLSPPQIPLVAIVGPTATGKSALAVALAEQVDGEIVNADSRQVYRGMEIGTAAPPAELRRRVPHHLYTYRDPSEPFSLAEYLAAARATIAGIAARRRRPILVGGSGLYVRAVIQGLAPPPVPPDPALRSQLEEVARRDPALLVRELAERDPAAAAKIDPRNLRRVIRAIEVIRKTGRPFSEQGRVQPPPYQTAVIGLTLERSALYARVDARVEAMLAAGWLDEVRRLRDAGLTPAAPAMSSHGYRELLAVVAGTLSLEEAKERIKRATHRLVRQQYTWFRLDDPAITWFAADRPDLVDAVVAHLRRSWCALPRCTASETTS